MMKQRWYRARLVMVGLAIAVGIGCTHAAAVHAQASDLSPEPIELTQPAPDYAPVSMPRVKMQDAWQQIYRRLPKFPMENSYINRENRKPAVDNTLVGRLIRYHVFVKGRPVASRLDWKLTLADYLGVNEVVQEEGYPSAEVLTENPMQGDVKVIQSLNLAQRDALVRAIVTVFAPPPPPPTGTRRSTRTTPVVPPPAKPPAPTVAPAQTQPGAADLLR